jgi:hypothetical protein
MLVMSDTRARPARMSSILYKHILMDVQGRYWSYRDRLPSSKKHDESLTAYYTGRDLAVTLLCPERRNDDPWNLARAIDELKKDARGPRLRFFLETLQVALERGV